MNRDPVSPAELNRKLPAKLEEIIHKALEKDRQLRYQHAADVRTDLQRLKRDTDSSVSRATPSKVSSPKRYTWVLWTFVALLVAGLGGWFAANGPRPAVRNPLSSAQFTRLTNFEGAKSDPAISPDGKFAAFISNRSGTFDIWLIQTNGNNLANLTQGRIGDARAPLRAVGFLRRRIRSVERGNRRQGNRGKRLMLWPSHGRRRHTIFQMKKPPKLPGRQMALGLSITPGKRATRHLWRITTAQSTPDRCKTSPDLHNHYQVWSKDGRWIYFVRGRPATHEMDLWRVFNRMVED